MARTRTGNYEIGFRQIGSDWEKDLAGWIDFARRSDLMTVDSVGWPIEAIRLIAGSGLKIGTVDLLQPWADLAAADAGKRKEAVAATVEHVLQAVEAGAKNFFAVVFPETDSADRRASFASAVAGYGELAAAIRKSGARISIEGYPGRRPLYPSLVCTPETYRTFFREIDSEVLGVNYDPSHLLRMGIDPLRFLREFAGRIVHVHAKDTEILAEGLYEYGNLQPATFSSPRAFGGHHWRYTIPGRGGCDWPGLLAELERANYRGAISIELEDADFDTSPEAEQRGLLTAKEYLESI